jgi:NAD(P)-dependent dehydrogenase (short-subunit alcohol dehydrogenase family)
MADGLVLVVGGARGLGREIAAHYHERGHPVVVTGKDPERARASAAGLGQDVVGLGFDLSKPDTIAPALADVGPVNRLVLTSIIRDRNPVREYDWASAVELSTMKLVGFVEVIHTLLNRLSDDSSVVLFGGRAKDRPYPGSTTVTSVNGAIASLINTLAIELAPIRFNAIHPGITGDSPEWRDKDLANVLARTPTKRLVTMADVVDATVFLLENPAMNGENLYVDGGWMLM